MASVAEALTEPAVIAGQVIALLTVASLTVRMVIQPAVRRISRTMQRVHALADLAERELEPNGGESIKDRVADLQGKLTMISRELWEVEKHQKFMATELEQVIMKQIEFSRKQQAGLDAMGRMEEDRNDG